MPNIEIKKLSPELLNDFLFYFDNVAFADHQDWSGCYCVEPHLRQAAEHELSKGTQSDCRQYAIDFINSGKLKGYLAYYDNEVAGWCNTNNKLNYEKILAREELHSDDDSDKKIKSIMCFNVAPNQRRKGIASRLLQQLCDDAKNEGFDLIEAYPYCGEPNVYYYFSGPISMYEKHEFKVYRKLEHEIIMRKHL